MANIIAQLYSVVAFSTTGLILLSVLWLIASRIRIRRFVHGSKVNRAGDGPVVWLIHGTFAARSHDWAEEDGVIAKQVLSLLFIRVTASNSLNVPTVADQLEIDTTKVALLRTVGDEASVLINTFYGLCRIAQGIGFLPDKLISKWFSRLVESSVKESIVNWANAGIAVSAISFGMALVASIIYPRSEFDDLYQVGIIASLVALLVSWSVAALLSRKALASIRVLVSLAIRVVTWPLIAFAHTLAGMLAGPEVALAGSWRQYTAENIPVGNWQLRVMNSEQRGVRHSELYNDPEVAARASLFVSEGHV